MKTGLRFGSRPPKCHELALQLEAVQNVARTQNLPLEGQMTTFDDRERSFEKKFALDQEFRFRAAARRNKLLAEWAAAKMGLQGSAVTDYVKAVVHADLLAKDDATVFHKVRKDFNDKGIGVSDGELRKAMGDFLAQSVAMIEADAKK
jgi:hypothetical protein